MSNASSPATAKSDQNAAAVTARSHELAIATTLLAFISLVVALQPSYPDRTDNAPVGQFSSKRALRYVEAIASKPHSVGTEHHRFVGDYIAGELEALGCRPEAQEETVVKSSRDRTHYVARVRNIIARIEGHQSTSAVLLVAHYDSDPVSPGAADNGAAVAALLETIRALKSGPPMRNDIIFLFSDAEEIGQLGAKAFVDKHPLARAVGVVVNFEARGTSGPSIMFEAGPKSGWVVNEFLNVMPGANASSLATAIYNVLPHSTDFGVFKRAGYPGLNFAFVGDWANYHSALDSVGRLNQRSLDSHGTYALGLARQLGGLNLKAQPARDLVYFNTVGTATLVYDRSLSLLWTWLSIACVIVVAGWAAWSKHLNFLWLTLAVVTTVLGVILAGGITFFLLRTLSRVSPVFVSMTELRGADLYITGFVCISACVGWLLQTWIASRSGIMTATLGAAVWWLVLVVASGRFSEINYVFIVPLLSALAVSALLTRMGDGRPTAAGYVLLLGAILPGIVVTVASMRLLVWGFNVPRAFVVAAFFCFSFQLFVPALQALLKRYRWAAGAAFGTAGVLLLASATVWSHVTRDVQTANRIIYIADTNKRVAFWTTEQGTTDSWTSQFFDERAVAKSATDYLPRWYRPFDSSVVWAQPAPVVELPPALSIVKDETTAGGRRLTLSMRAAAGTAEFLLRCEADVEIQGVSLGTVTLESAKQAYKDRFTLVHYGTPRAGDYIEFQLPSGVPVKFVVLERNYQIPNLLNVQNRSITPRLASMMPKRVSGDGTILLSSFVF